MILTIFNEHFLAILARGQYKDDDLGEIQELYKIVIELLEKISKGDKC